MKKVVVTGATGFLANPVIERKLRGGGRQSLCSDSTKHQKPISAGADGRAGEIGSSRIRTGVPERTGTKNL